MLGDPVGSKKEMVLKRMNPKLRKKLHANKIKRERELLRRKMVASVDFIG